MISLDGLALGGLILGVGVVVYTYLGYPLILGLLGLFTSRRSLPSRADRAWPRVSVSVAVYNEEDQIEGLISSLLALDYPREKLQIVITSDGSDDRTEEIIEGFADRGVKLVRLEERGGKTRAESEAAQYLEGDLVVNTDASIRLAPDAIKQLVAAFDDPGVGLASGRDISVGSGGEAANRGEAGYVGYEMKVRDLETRLGGIVGASGSLYAIRPELHRVPLPHTLSRDFASALIARQRGFRAVSVPSAVCRVPRTPSLRREYHRKVRTIARGMETLAFKRSLLNLFRYPLFAWMLVSHKVCRWAVPWFGAVAYLGLGVLSVSRPWARTLFSLGGLGLVLAALGWARAKRGALPRFLAIPAFFVMGNLAAMHGLVQVLRGERNATWEPTRREAVDST